MLGTSTCSRRRLGILAWPAPWGGTASEAGGRRPGLCAPPASAARAEGDAPWPERTGKPALSAKEDSWKRSWVHRPGKPALAVASSTVAEPLMRCYDLVIVTRPMVETVAERLPDDERDASGSCTGQRRCSVRAPMPSAASRTWAGMLSSPANDVRTRTTSVYMTSGTSAVTN